MEPRLDACSLLGCAALAAALLLSWPGVEVVSANDGAAASQAPAPLEAPMCTAEAPPAPSASAVLEQVRRSVGTPHEAPGEVVALGNRGYDEGPPPSVALDLIRLQLEQLQQQP